MTAPQYQQQAPQGYAPQPQQQYPAPPAPPQAYAPQGQQFQQQAPQGYQQPPMQPQFQAPPQQQGFDWNQGQQQVPQNFGQPLMQPQFQGQPNTPQPESDTSDYFGGAPSISFNANAGYQRGTFRGGRIISKVRGVQTDMKTKAVKTFNDGRPMPQLVVTVASAEKSDPTDNGERRIFLKGDMTRAARVAFQQAGATDLEDGGWFYLAWTDEKAATTAGFNNQKLYTAIYARPGQPDPMAGQPAYQAPAAPAPQQPAPPMQQNPYAGAQQMVQQGQHPIQQAAQYQQQPQYVQQPAPQGYADPNQVQQPQYAQAPAQPQQQGAPAGYNPFGGQ
jgi:hypothetical protein